MVLPLLDSNKKKPGRTVVPGAKILLAIALACSITIAYRWTFPSVASPNPHKDNISIDFDGGYLIVCLSMGRYGNQMEQLLGVLGNLPKSTGRRTLVLPPFLSYQRDGSFVVEPLEDVFDLEKLREYYPKIVPMQDFMDMLAPKIWQEGKRVLYCPHQACKVPEWIQPFWDHYGIHRFDDYQTVQDKDLYRLPATKNHLVVATTYAPLARYPMNPEHRFIAHYFEWKDPVPLPQDAILVACHVRAGTDWVWACQNNGIGKPDFMASPQSHDANDQQSFVVTQSICLPNTTEIVNRLLAIAQRHYDNPSQPQKQKLLLLYVASDVPDMAETLWQQLEGEKSSRYHGLWEPTNTTKGGPLRDVAILSRAHYFVGNCVSSFTSFAARMRRESLSTEFFGVD